MNLNEHLPVVLTVEEAARFLPVGPAAVRKRCRQGEIRAVKRGRRWLIARDYFFHEYLGVAALGSVPLAEASARANY